MYPRSAEPQALLASFWRSRNHGPHQFQVRVVRHPTPGPPILRRLARTRAAPATPAPGLARRYDAYSTIAGWAAWRILRPASSRGRLRVAGGRPRWSPGLRGLTGWRVRRAPLPSNGAHSNPGRLAGLCRTTRVAAEARLRTRQR